MIHFHHHNLNAAIRLCLMAIIAFALATPPAEAQTTGTISIGGKVYGGGKQGAILTGNTTSTNETAIESVEISNKDFRTSDAAQASQVTIHDGTIVGVFGGGEMGRAYGKTNVTVTNGTIGIGTVDPDSIAALTEATRLVNGNVFGAGDGDAAAVFGGSNVTVIGGRVNGSVYGGGNEADLIGCSELTLQGGIYVGAVFGGARKSNIYGYTYVNIDGLNAKNDLHIIDVYGGNDIAGEIHPDEHWSWTKQSFLKVPFDIVDGSQAQHLTTAPKAHVNNTWNAFIRATEDVSANHFRTLIDNLYGGGNGDYDYTTSNIVDGKETNLNYGLSKPVIDRTYMQLEGGAFGNVYGGGNAATVAKSTDICLLNDTEVNSDYLASLAGTPSEKVYTANYQFNRVFGGNNKEPMAIRPNWYLEKATVNNLYSGGNAGAMTYFDNSETANTRGGIIIAVESDDMTINNVYGGCRMADVVPSGTYDATKAINAETFLGTPFQKGYAARVLIKGGNINNVYGGNDISGNVYYGAQVEILSNINGDVYGAGNGSYAYTDNPALKDDPAYSDLYYNGKGGGLASAQALNSHRPNVEKSWVHVSGDAESNKHVFIGGALYCGGNSATLRTMGGNFADAKSHLQIGSNVVVDSVFLGSNGANMVASATDTDMLQVIKNGPTDYDATTLGAYSSLDLTQSDQFKEYMRGVEVGIIPEVAFDTNYADHSSMFGSMFCGGNVGSMSKPGLFTANFLNSIIVYSKLVGGSNNANVAQTDYNAFHLGGIIGAPDPSGNKVQLNVAGLLLEPRVLIRPTYDEESHTYTPFRLNEFSYADSSNTMLAGANIYGGCYTSGYINGGVTINISENAISDALADSHVSYSSIQDDVLASTLSVYGGGYGQETEIWGDTHINITGNGQIMKAYGGGEMGVVGKLQRNADGHFATQTVQEWFSVTTTEDIAGYPTPVTDYTSRPHTVAKFAEDGTHNAIVTLEANLLNGDLLNAAKIYGGGFQGTVSGNTIVNLNRGRVYDAFGGASNADILGHTEMYVGKTSAPSVTHNVYGANDFGGLIVGNGVFYVDNNKDGDHEDTMEKILSQTYVEYTAGNIAGDLFGGPCGAYKYDAPQYASTVVVDSYTYDEYKTLTGNSALTTEEFTNLPAALKAKPGFCRPQLLENLLTNPMLIPDPEGKREHVGYAANSFVNIISQSTLSSDNIRNIFGAGQGLKGDINLADERGSYVRLMSASKAQRPVGELSKRVYGAGYCSNTNRSLVDAYTGYYATIFGGAHGITYEDVLEIVDHNGSYQSNYMGYRAAVRLYDMDNNQMDIYGGGANAGAEETGVVLYGGQARNVYGASYAQGITYAASVEIPATSTTHVSAIFGGAEGGSDNFPCDAYNTFVTWNSPNARVNNAIYGGNNKYRMTRNAYIAINSPVRNFEGKLTNVFGGGYGPETVTLYTSIGLQPGAEVANVFGGGNNGQVLDTPSFRYYLDDGQKVCEDGTLKPEADGHKTYPKELLGTGIYGYQKYLNDSEVIGFHNWIVRNCWKPDPVTHEYPLDSRGQPLGSYTANAHGHAHPVYFLSTQMDDMKNTNVFIMKGARVAENAYGGGLGDKALVSGETAVHLWGGTVEGDIFGGGFGGHIEEYPHLIFPAGGQIELTMSSTHVDLQGGITRNVYGGGLNGRVTGSTHVVLGTKDEHPYDFYGTTISGQYEHQIICGDPIVERSLYGGGQMGPVYGTTNVTINQGHVGYKYDASQEVQQGVDTNGNPIMKSTADCYVENLDLNDEGDNFLDQNGNAFGAGYGEGASVDNTYVNIYGGVVRNSLYGGGEIAAVGRGKMKVESGAVRELKEITVPGRTHVYIYNGLIQGDVFGGGRGYSYDLTGNEVVGKTLYTDGYVFGTTDVEVRGGTVGTPATLEKGHGNVFGGGNIGYCFTDAKKHGKRGEGNGEGRYYTNEWRCNQSHCNYIERSLHKPNTCSGCGRSIDATDPRYQTDFTKMNDGDGEDEKYLSEDTRVVISPWAQVTTEDGVTIEGRLYKKGDYIPTEVLDCLAASAPWTGISTDGVNILNAVFAGGNVSAGSDKVYANAITVFGNATASINDVYGRDLVTIGTDNIGGLYGDGNLTFVDGYRELNITDYGTDFYRQPKEIDVEAFNLLSDRERAYYKLQYTTSTPHPYEYYVCTEDGEYGGTLYQKGKNINQATYDNFTPEEKEKWKHAMQEYTTSSSISSDTYDMMTEAEQQQWQIHGLCSTFAGRVLNTIQRADFCGVFGSRIVLQGAQDRVPEVVDYTHYTLNRVGEVSLNKRGDHGNYFGLYNVVNYLGALTSDVSFNSVRTTDNSDANYAADGKTYYAWKEANEGNKKRNNGTCHNMVALASGVYLELVNEIGSSPEHKNYGPITGIVQLDLINVMPGLGGGYVYAKNVHGTPNTATTATGLHENLSIYNANAVNNTLYIYDENNRKTIQTSGNFIHNVKQIVDDCFPGGGQYMNYEVSPAHYWYIRGEYYVYDQYVSAYTGSSNAYLENIDIPLTITAGAHGKLDILDIKPNYYAYYFDEAQTTKLGEAGGKLIVLNGNTYGLNDVITYWDYMQLSEQQKKHFVPETYVTTAEFIEGADGTGATVPKGTVMLPSDYTAYVAAHPLVWDTQKETQVDIIEVLHISNAISHENGYVLTVDMTNPVVWDKWYSPENGALKLNGTEYKNATDQSQYKAGPTYYTTEPGVYGQRYYELDDIITDYVKAAYLAIPTADKENLNNDTTHPQATIVQAYVAISAAEYDISDGDEGTIHKNVQEGVGISATEYAQLDGETKAKFAKAYTCTNTFEEDKDNNKYIYHAELISEDHYNTIYNALVEKYKETADTDADAVKMAQQTMSDHFDNANMVTKAGWYGGQYFAANHNYRTLDTWSSLSAEDRTHFKFRYDALDAILFSDYPGRNAPGSMTDYDGDYWAPTSGWPEKHVYGARQPIDYKATYNGTTPLTYKDADGQEHTIAVGSDPIDRVEYEALPNEQHHYTIINVAADQVGRHLHIAKESFIHGGVTYPAGRVIDDAVYTSYDSDAPMQAKLFTDFTPSAPGDYYVCRTGYTIGELGEGKVVTPVGSTTPIAIGAEVPVGTIIDATTYQGLANRQKNFVVHGNSPIETSTFYVAADSNIDDLSKDRVITVIYQYKYEESDENGQNIEEITEKHVINIHIVFKSGVPTVGQLQPPSIVLPGETVGLKTPAVSEGAYTILGGGWELYSNAADAEKHQNGASYTNNATPMYWYQDGYYVAYYTKTYLGKTYSNAVQFKVANYHDIADVIADEAHSMYVDHPNVHRDSKIYISSDYTDEHPDATESEIDMLYDLFQRSLATNTKTINVDVQDTQNGKPLYYVVVDGKPTTNTTTEPKEADLAFPVTHKEDKIVPVFDEHARNCENLEFHITSDVATKKAEWQPIGWIPTGSETDAQTCFRGNVHGHGMTVSGINNSLFENLCGSVYNLGVTGSFQKSGIADKVSIYKDWDPTEPQGLAQNCWIHTTGTPTPGVLPVIGVKNNLTNFSDASGIHTFNCYFPIEDGYSFSVANPYEAATPRPMLDFHNGSVAFDLNGFYLHKRYADQRVAKSEAENTLSQGGSIYYYWIENAEGSLKDTPNEGYYNQGALHKYGTDYYGYVENIYADGDFVYAMGEIPTTTNERFYSPLSRYLPIWPDDYLFFGQMLTYGYDEINRPFQNMPSHIEKTSDIDHRLITDNKTNVVFRAPAYYRNSEKSVIHFNPGAVFADHVKGHPEWPVHSGLTAIDFTGFNDVIRLNGSEFVNIAPTESYYNGPRNGINFPPALDFTTLLSFETHDITQNLLAYAPSANDGNEGHKNTNDVLTAYFNEPAFSDYYSSSANYRKVGALDASTLSSIHGHVVQKNGAYTAHTDHFLVDRQDFNAPIAYNFDDNHLMWYQRKPDNYADRNQGWEGVSLPFSAELVSTQTKGEITHFYNTAIDAAYAPGYTSGHEYWLREFTGTNSSSNTADEIVTTALMHYPIAVAGKKVVPNTFLWDYYYNTDGSDANSDYYTDEPNNDAMRKQYYGAARTYDNYPFSEAGKPYIVGFPGSRYYEFDLSGTFVPEHSGAITPAKLEAQTISFVSKTGINVDVSDNEMQEQYAANTHDGYMFAPTYLNVVAPKSGQITTLAEFNDFFETNYTQAEFDALPAEQKNNYYYTLNAAGSAFDKTEVKTTVPAFRPYFLIVGSKQLKAPATRSITFGMSNDTQFQPDDDTIDAAASHGLRIYAKKHKIVVESTLDAPKEVIITTPAGQVITTFTIQPGERIATPVDAGIYVTNLRKLIVE